MRKNYFLILLFFIVSAVKAQQPCDTINLPVSQNWSSNCYASLTAFPGVINGYISGVNSDHFIQQANYFDLSSTTYSYLLGTAVKFSIANTSNPDSLSRLLFIRIFSDNNGVPGTEITTPQTIAQIALSQVKTDVANGSLTNIVFPSAIALPASKKFYVSVDMSNFQWNPNEGIRDSICISTTGDNETVNAAWNFDADVSKWKAYKKSWGAPPDEIEPLDASLYIFPYASLTAAGGCNSVLPVNLLSFTATETNRDVTVRWQVSNETNMKGYEVEKANRDGHFTSIRYSSALNSVKNQDYSIVDGNAFATEDFLQYRLKQINANGEIQYSKVIALHSNGSGITFQNPFSGVLKVKIALSTPQNVSAAIYDMQGKQIAIRNVFSNNTGESIITINQTAALKAGTYLLKLNVGNKIVTYKILKQN